MASQLVYTSAAKLLDAGRSGFGTVARSRLLSPLVVNSIEQVSQFANERGLDRKRVIHCHRRITAGSSRFHLLSRIRDAGSDYTGRTNHIAHQLVVTSEEAARAAARGLTPADVLRQFDWLSEWSGGARFFETAEEVALDSFQPDGVRSNRQTWVSATGNPEHARLLAWVGAPRTGVIIALDSSDRLALMAEALAEFDTQSWSRTFTTSLETTDELSGLDWIVTTPAGFAEIRQRCGSRTVFDLCNPHSLPVPAAPVVAEKPKLVIPTPTLGQHVHQPVPSPSIGSSSSRPVNVTVATQGAVARMSNPRSTQPWKEKRGPFILVAGVVAIAAIVGLLVSTVLRGGKSKEQTDQESAGQSPALKQDKETQDGIVRKLQKECDTDFDTATGFAKWVVRKDSQEWVGIVINANKEFKDMLGRARPSDPRPDRIFLTEFSSPPDGNPPWVLELWKGFDNLRQLQSNDGKDDNSIGTRIQKLDSAVTSLKSASEGLPNLKKCDPDLFCHFVKPWIEEAASNPDRDRLESLFGKDSKIWLGKRGDLLLNDWEKSVSNIDIAQRDKLLAALNDIKVNLGDKYEALVLPFAKKKMAIAPVEKVEPPAPTPSDQAKHPVINAGKAVLSSSRAPDKQVIITSSDELKNGVQIDILKEIIPLDVKVDKVSIKGLEIYAYIETMEGLGEAKSQKSPVYKDAKPLLKESGSDFFCPTLISKPGDPKFYDRDGRFSLEKSDLTTVTLSHEGRIAYVVVGPKGDPVVRDLKFKLHMKDKDQGALINSSDVGKSLMAWIKLVSEVERRKLIYKFKPDEVNSKIGCTDGTTIVSTAPKQVETLHLQKDNIDEIRRSLKKFKNLSEDVQKTRSQIEKNSADMKVAMKELRESLSKALGDESKLDTSIKYYFRNNSNGINDWEGIKNSVKMLQQYIDSLTIQDHPNSLPFADEVKKIHSISVLTNDGRELFEATLEP
ncbi:MAG: hypothetical protein WCK77_14940 [Verrucomicrobiota bacterium]